MRARGRGTCRPQPPRARAHRARFVALVVVTCTACTDSYANAIILSERSAPPRAPASPAAARGGARGRSDASSSYVRRHALYTCSSRGRPTDLDGHRVCAGAGDLMPMFLVRVIVALAQGQYNPAWGPSPCPNGQCVPKWTPTYNVSATEQMLDEPVYLLFALNRLLCYPPPAFASSQRWMRTRREQMSKSTIFMPCNYSGHYDPAVAAKFGIVDFVRFI